jgi:uncharacterized protein (TIGR02246 family)
MEVLMARRLALGSVVVVMIAAFLVAEQTPAAAPAEAGSGVQAEVHAVVAAYSQAIAEKKLDACVAAYGGPEGVMLGTGPGERWVGEDEIRIAHQEFFRLFDTETSKPTWRVIRVNGEVAWIAGMSEITDYLKNVKKEFFLNFSAVLEKRDGKWKIVLFHFSNLTGMER